VPERAHAVPSEFHSVQRSVARDGCREYCTAVSTRIAFYFSIKWARRQKDERTSTSALAGTTTLPAEKNKQSQSVLIIYYLGRDHTDLRYWDGCPPLT
jgi:hypothetical protein